MSEDTDLLSAFEQADSTERLTPPAASPEVAPQAEQPEQATQQAIPTQTQATQSPKYVEHGDDEIVRFKVGGQVVEKSWRELIQQQALLPGDYTRKMQTLSQERQSFQSERDSYKSEREQFLAERNQLAQALQDPRKIEALYLAVLAKQGGQPQAQPGQQMEQPTQRALTPDEISALVEQRFQNHIKQAETQRENAGRETALEKHVESILGSNPVLKALPDINNYLYSRVMGMVVPGQTSVQEALSYLDVVATEVSTSLNTHFNQARKQDAVAAGQLANGIEPRGGSPNMPQAKRYDPKKGLDDDEMEKDIIAYLKSVGGAA